MRSVPKYCIVILWLFLISTPAWSVEHQVPPGGLHVEDGDTVLIVIEGEEQRVQLTGIDAPEDTDNPKLQRDMQRTGLERERLLVLGQLSREYLRRLTKIGAPYTLHYQPAAFRVTLHHDSQSPFYGLLPCICTSFPPSRGFEATCGG